MWCLKGPPSQIGNSDFRHSSFIYVLNWKATACFRVETFTALLKYATAFMQHNLWGDTMLCLWQNYFFGKQGPFTCMSESGRRALGKKANKQLRYPNPVKNKTKKTLQIELQGLRSKTSNISCWRHGTSYYNLKKPYTYSIVITIQVNDLKNPLFVLRNLADTLVSATWLTEVPVYLFCKNLWSPLTLRNLPHGICPCWTWYSRVSQYKIDTNIRMHISSLLIKHDVSWTCCAEFTTSDKHTFFWLESLSSKTKPTFLEDSQWGRKGRDVFHPHACFFPSKRYLYKI